MKQGDAAAGPAEPPWHRVRTGDGPVLIDPATLDSRAASHSVTPGCPVFSIASCDGLRRYRGFDDCV